VLKRNNIEQQNSMLEVNEHDAIVNFSSNIPADTADFINCKGPEH
jgi:hypothetical protein